MKYNNYPSLPDYVRDHYSFASQWHPCGAHQMHYLDEGRGTPVLMLHGNPSWSFYYRNLVQALNHTHRCIVPDHIGCGLSDKPGDADYDYTLAQRVNDLESLLDSLALEQPIHLVVHDWGGMIGGCYAVAHPERIRSLTILNTAAFPLPQSKAFPWALWLCRNTRLGALMVRGGNAFSRGAAWVGCKRRRMTKALRDAYCYPYDSWQNRIATLRFVQDIPLRPGDRGYDRITETAAKLPQLNDVPKLIGWGLKDFVFDRHFLAEWQRLFPDMEAHIYPDAGHYILEDAIDTLIPAIVAFINQVDASSAAPASSVSDKETDV